MMCGPLALQRAAGIDYREVVLRIRALREQKGQRVSLRGGTTISELQAVARQYGWTVRRVFEYRRVRLADLVKRITKGRWILHQPDHFVGVSSARYLREIARHARNPKRITAAYRVYKRVRRHALPAIDSKAATPTLPVVAST